jgi:AcrR family transcriptional regulator
MMCLSVDVSFCHHSSTLMSVYDITMIVSMGRWQPDAMGRLQRAALDLYIERGFEQTTVAEIAERAGVTERTFFRYFSDKREVLFGGSEALLHAAVKAVADADQGATPIDIVAGSIETIAGMLQEGSRQYSRQRQAAIVANPGLQERELLKLAGMAAAMSEALGQRGISAPVARLSAEAGISVFSLAFERWISDDDVVDYVAVVRELFGQLRAVTAGT